MLIEKSGDLFESGAACLVNPVNCEGVMGKGLALEFKKRYPKMFTDYRQWCRDQLLAPGQPLLWRQPWRPTAADPWVVLFPTKGMWRYPSRLEWIDSGLQVTRQLLDQSSLDSVALPALGCGLGGLALPDVVELVHRYFDDWSGQCVLYVN